MTELNTDNHNNTSFDNLWEKEFLNNTAIRTIIIKKEQRFCLDCGKILPMKIPIGYLHTDCNPEKKHEMQNLRESSKARKLENERANDLRELHENSESFNNTLMDWT